MNANENAVNNDIVRSKVLIVDDHPLVREGLVHLINRQIDLVCCGEADSFTSAQKIFEAQKPDLVTVDIRLQNGDGLEMLRAFKKIQPTVVGLVISQCDEMLYAERALKAGARGYVMKEKATDEVLTAIHTVLDGGIYASPRVAMQALQNVVGAKPPGTSHSLGRLSDRELQVLQLIGSGMSSQKVAAKLFLSVKTVETHRENIKHKLGLANAAELVRFATTWVSGMPSQYMGEAVVTPLES
jgi:DNA-binding NarL/FixJ family response regulator